MTGVKQGPNTKSGSSAVADLVACSNRWEGKQPSSMMWYCPLKRSNNSQVMEVSQDGHDESCTAFSCRQAWTGRKE